jgi:hypothetical protein
VQALEQQVVLYRPLVHLVHHHALDALQAALALAPQLLQQQACGSEGM